MEVEWDRVRASIDVRKGGLLLRSSSAYNLNDLLPPEAGWVLERALAINNQGWIIGTGYSTDDRGKNRKGTIRSFLLVPSRTRGAS